MRTEEAKQLVEQIQGEKREKDSSDLRAALRLLAEELNTKETHFILELLQNAEDNEYGSEIPELSLRIAPGNPTCTPSADGCLIVQNNEIGFQLANVRSLSSVGQSTKKKDANRGYIGEKGIGFKSVFRITDAPHIISNGFQFRFQKPTDDEPLGYILPHWIDEVPENVDSGLTVILLPLLPGKRKLIEAQFSRIAPETVLFLNKLRKLRLGEDRTIVATGQPPCVSVASNGTQVSYFVLGAMCPKPQDVVEEKRPGITSREVTIAFPLEQEPRCTGRLFAYLPTEYDTGLPFLVNADFILNSNRERVLEDRHWNRWLRDQIAPTFVKSFLEFLGEPRWQEIAHRFIPIASDLMPSADFVRPVVEAIQAALQSERCVLSDEKRQELPQRVVVPGALARSLLSDLARERLNFSLLHPSWESDWSSRLKPLGVKSLTFMQLFEACSDAEFLKGRDIPWWETILELCAKCDISAQTVGSFPLFLCADGSCRRHTDRVYSHGDNSQAAVRIAPEWPKAYFLDLELQKRLQQRTEVWGWLTKTLGLHPFSITSYITGNLLEWMQRQGREHLLQATRFIAANVMQLDASAKDAICKRIPWLLSDETVLTPDRRGKREVVTPECLEGDIGWNLLFSSLDRHFWTLHDDYCSRLSAEELAGMRELFKCCGATSLPDPRLREVSPGQHLYDAILGRCAKAVLGTPTLRDWVAPGWMLGLEDVQPSTKVQKVAALERWLKLLPQQYSQRFLFCEKADSQGDWQQIGVWSEFGEALRSKPWLRTTKGYVPPHRAFLDTPEFREFFGETVPYVSVELPATFLDKLGVRIRLTADVLIGLLREMSALVAPNIEMLGRLYRRLQDCTFETGCFARERLIFLAKPAQRWLPADKLVWDDAGELFDDDFGYVSLTYGSSDLHRFFLKLLRIPKRPELRHYAMAWKSLCSGVTGDRTLLEKKLKIIVTRLAESYAELNELEWWRQLKPQLRIWTDQGEFHAPARVYVPDHATAAVAFRNRIQVAFPLKQSNAVLRFMLAVGCRSLAEAVRIQLSEAPGGVVRECPSLLTAAAKELCLFLVFGRPDWQNCCKLIAALHEAVEVLVPAMSVDYTLAGNFEAGSQQQQRDAFWDVANGRLLVRDVVDQETVRDAAARAIATEFFGEAASAEVQAEFFRVLTVSIERARNLLHERVKWRLTPEQEQWVRQQGWTLCTLELEDIEPASERSSSSDVPGGQASAGGSPDAGPPAGKGSPDRGRLDGDGLGKPSERPTPSAPAGEPGKQGGDKEPEDGGTEDGTQDLHDADTTSADFVEVRAHTRSRPQRSRIQKTQLSQGSASSGLSTVSPTDRAALEQCGREFAAKKLESMGYSVTTMSQMNPGFDLRAQKPGSLLKVEVKAHAGEAGTVFITQREWEEYLRTRCVKGEAWELWNVENLAKVQGSRPTIQRVRHIPKSAMKESGYWIDLSQCSGEQTR